MLAACLFIFSTCFFPSRKDSPLAKIPENNLTILDPEHIIQAFLRLLVKLDTTLYVDISFER